MVINLKSKTNLSGFHIVYEGAVNLERKGFYGSSHLSEHLMYGAMDKFKNQFEQDCITFDARTYYNEIVFSFIGLDEKIIKYKEIIAHELSNYILDEQIFLNEKKIIIEEYNTAFSRQGFAHNHNLFRKLLNNYGIVGLREDIENISYENITSHINMQFKSPSKIINVSKNDKFEFPFKFNSIKNKIYLEYGSYNSPLELGNNFKTTASVILISPLIENDFNYIKFAAFLLSNGLHSPFYKEIRLKRGLCYSIQLSVKRINNQGIIYIHSISSKENANKIISAIKDILSNITYYVQKDRFNLIKDHLNVKKSIDSIYRHMNINQFLVPGEWDIYNILNYITYEKLIYVYSKYFDINKYYISVDSTEF